MRPFQTLIIAGLILLLSSFFLLTETLDFQLSDTWYIVSLRLISRILGLIIIILGFIYRQFGDKLGSRKMSWTHILITILLSYGIVIITFWADNYQNVKPRRYIDYSNWETLSRIQYGNLLPFLWTWAFVFAQSLLIVNLAMRQKKQRFSI